MIWVDWCILIVALVSVVTGIVRGFTREVFSIVTWAAALIVAWIFGDDVAALLRAKITNPALAMAVGYAVTFFSGLLVGALLSSVIVQGIRESRFAGADRTIGAGFGLLRAVFLIALFVMLAGNMGSKRDTWWKQSKLIHHFQWLADGLQSVVPDSWIERIRPPIADAAPESY